MLPTYIIFSMQKLVYPECFVDISPLNVLLHTNTMKMNEIQFEVLTTLTASTSLSRINALFTLGNLCCKQFSLELISVVV